MDQISIMQNKVNDEANLKDKGMSEHTEVTQELKEQMIMDQEMEEFLAKKIIGVQSGKGDGYRYDQV